MRAYADYEYYSGTYKGTAIPEAAFERIAMKASRYIDQITFGRIVRNNAGEYPALPLCVRDCACDMAEKIYALEGENGNAREKKSENTDGYVVTYVTDSVDGGNAEEALKRKLFSVAHTYLSNTELMHLGGDV